MFLFSVLFGSSVCFIYHIIFILKCLIFALTSSSNLMLSRQDYVWTLWQEGLMDF